MNVSIPNASFTWLLRKEPRTYKPTAASSTGHGVQRQGATNGHGTLCQGAVYMTYRGKDVPGAAGEEVRTGLFFRMERGGPGWVSNQMSSGSL